jgi:hypothetical protein
MGTKDKIEEKQVIDEKRRSTDKKRTYVMQEDPADPAPKRSVHRREGTAYEPSAWVPSTFRGGGTGAVPEMGDLGIGMV